LKYIKRASKLVRESLGVPLLDNIIINRKAGTNWKQIGAGIVLSLPTFALTKGRWKQFLDKINQYGVPILAYFLH
jgi:hypothetical protein